MQKYQEMYRGVLVRSPGLLHKSVALTPSLGVAFYTDPTYENKPVLELCKLRMGLDRSIMLSWDEDQKLAMWDPDKRDDFFDQANRRGIVHRFRASRLEHKANVIAAANLLSGATMQNLHGALSGKIEPTSKELDADCAKELVEMAYNSAMGDAAALYDVATTMNLSPTALRYAIDSVVRAMDGTDVWRNPAELFQSIMLSNKQLCDALMETARHGETFLKQVVNESRDWLATEKYFHEGFRDFDVLAVEPSADFLTKAVYGNESGDGKRQPNDFSGDFPVLAELWSSSSQCDFRMNAAGAKERFGFNIGPAHFRQYGMICDRIQNGSDWVGGSRIYELNTTREKVQPGPVNATPPDLPVELAEKRLALFENKPVEFAAPITELKEIIDAHADKRPVNPAVFRESSLATPPATAQIEIGTLSDLQDKLDVIEDKLAQQSDNAANGTSWEHKLASLQADELEFWQEQHPDYPESTAAPQLAENPDMSLEYIDPDLPRIKAAFQSIWSGVKPAN